MTRLQANLLLSLAAMIWGSSFVVQQIGTGSLGIITFTGARFVLGAVIILPFAVKQLRRVESNERRFEAKDWYGLLSTGCILLIAASLQQYGILHTTVTNAGFLTALYVPLVPLLGLIFLRRKVHFIIWPGAICCFIGTYILSGAHRVDLAVGDFWVIASTFFWACHVILVGILASRTGAPLVVAATQFFVCGLIGLIFGFIFESPVYAELIGAVPGIVYVGVFSVAMAFTLQVIGQRFTPAADAAIILSSETLFAAIGGMVFLGERLTIEQLSGGLLILVSILVVELLPMTRLGRPRPLH